MARIPADVMAIPPHRPEPTLSIRSDNMTHAVTYNTTLFNLIELTFVLNDARLFVSGSLPVWWRLRGPGPGRWHRGTSEPWLIQLTTSRAATALMSAVRRCSADFNGRRRCGAIGRQVALHADHAPTWPATLIVVRGLNELLFEWRIPSLTCDRLEVTYEVRRRAPVTRKKKKLAARKLNELWCVADCGFFFFLLSFIRRIIRGDLATARKNRRQNLPASPVWMFTGRFASNLGRTSVRRSSIDWINFKFLSVHPTA